MRNSGKVPSAAPVMGWRYLGQFFLTVICTLSTIMIFGDAFTHWLKNSVGIVDIIQPPHLSVINNSLFSLTNNTFQTGNEVPSVPLNNPVATNEQSITTSSSFSTSASSNSFTSNYNYTLLLSVLDVNSARWRFTSSQLDYAYKSCEDTNIHMKCFVYTNDKTLFQAETGSNITSKPMTVHQCSMIYVPGKTAQQVMAIQLHNFQYDFVGIMLADTYLRPHLRAKQRAAYNNIHLPSFLATMDKMQYDQCAASVLNHKLFPFLRPQPDCVARSSLFAEIQFSVYTPSSFQCFQRHMNKHIGYHSDLISFAMVFHIVCNASVGILDRHHIGWLCVCVYWYYHQYRFVLLISTISITTLLSLHHHHTIIIIIPRLTLSSPLVDCVLNTTCRVCRS